MAETTTKAPSKKPATKTTAVSEKPEAKKPVASKTAVTSEKPAAKKAAAVVAVVETKGTASKPAASKKPAVAKTAAAKPAPKSPEVGAIITGEQRYRMVAEAAYYRAELHQFMSDPLRDWIEAESEIAARLGDSK
jgi:hypothetical protein